MRKAFIDLFKEKNGTRVGTLAVYCRRFGRLLGVGGGVALSSD